MAYRILTPRMSFISFSEAAEVHCIYGALNFCFPVVNNNDVAFPYIIEADTEGEAAALAGGGVTIGIVNDITDPGFLVQFNTGMERFLMNPLQVLFTQTSLPGAIAALDVGQCFKIRVVVFGATFHSTSCFERIEEDCFTSVASYWNDESGFGFPCIGGAGEMPGGGEDLDCRPTVIEFSNVSTLTVPYTSQMIAKYGQIPSCECYIIDENGVPTKMGITEQLIGGIPPSAIFWDFSGPSFGYVRIGV